MEYDPVKVFLAETFGTGLLVLLGDGVVAGVLLAKSKSQNAGWIVITAAWAFAVYVGVVVAGPISGAHLNPAVTIGLAVNGATPWDHVPVYLAGEFVGAFIGAILVSIHYWDHFKETEDPGLKLAVFSTGPNIRNIPLNFVSEVIGTFVLVFVVLAFGTNGSAARPRCPRRPARRPARVVDRPVARRHHRLRDQPGPRPRAADHPRDPADPGQG